MVADLLHVPRELAPLLDLALGDTAQFLLVRDMTSLDPALKRRSHPLAGRVGFIPVPTQCGSENPIESDDLGIPLDQLVTCEHPELADLPRFLLGSTRLVPDLDTARNLARHHPGRFRFVTRQGELLERDGTLIVGTGLVDSGVVSRKSELRDLRQQASQTDAPWPNSRLRATNFGANERRSANRSTSPSSASPTSWMKPKMFASV
jgi:chromosome segregation protein